MHNTNKELFKIKSLEDIAEKNTVLHRIHPLAKIIITIAFLVMVISYGKYQVSGLLLFFTYPILAMSLGDIPYRQIFMRVMVALPFGAFAGISNLILDREIVFSMAGWAVTFGMISFASIVIKTILTVSGVLILVATTPMNQIMHQLVHIGFPKIFILQIVLTYRYIGVLIHEATSMMIAYRLRSTLRKGIDIKDMSTFLGQLLLRSFGKADKIYSAMKCRGFDGTYRYTVHEPMKGRDWLYTGTLVATFVSVRFINIGVLVENTFR